MGPNGTIIQNVGQFTGYGNTALFGSVATNFQAIMEMISNVNSNYNAMVAEVLNRSLKSVQFDANYTWSHSSRLRPECNYNHRRAGNNWYDPYSNPRLNYGDSSWNTPDRFVAYALYNFPNLHTNSFAQVLTNDWSLNDSFQMPTACPILSASAVSSAPAFSATGTAPRARPSIPADRSEHRALPAACS